MNTSMRATRVREYCATCGHLRQWHEQDGCTRHVVNADRSVAPCACSGWVDGQTLSEMIEQDTDAAEAIGMHGEHLAVFDEVPSAADVSQQLAQLLIYSGERPAHPDDEPTGKLLASRALSSAEAAQLSQHSRNLGLSEAEKARARKAARGPVVRALTELAKELAAKAGAAGVTVADLRLTGVQRGLLPQSGDGRELSYLGAVLRAAGLVATSYTRRSVIGVSHGNAHRIYVAPEFRQ
jgi:hypothetical protein